MGELDFDFAFAFAFDLGLDLDLDLDLGWASDTGSGSEGDAIEAGMRTIMLGRLPRKAGFVPFINWSTVDKDGSY